MLFKKSENHGFSRYICLLLLLVIFLACSLFLAVSLGSVTIDIQDTSKSAFGKPSWCWPVCLWQRHAIYCQ